MKNLIKVALIPALFLTHFTVWGQSHGWTVNPPDYEYSCDINTIVLIGAGEVTTGTVGAFVGGVCRGFADGAEFSETGKTVFTIMCHSNAQSGEILSFQYFDPAGSLYYTVNETVEFIAEAVIGTATDPLLFNIDENTAPVLAPIGDKSVCQLSPLEFTASATDTDVPANTLTFSLTDAPAGASISPSTGAFIWTPDVSTTPGIYSFSVIVTDNGVPVLSDEEKISVTVAPLPAQPGPFTTSTATVCSGTSNVAYTVPDDPAVTYDWTYTGSGATITGSTNSVTVDYSDAATSGTLSVTATNSCGTSAARTLDITVNANPSAPLVGEITQPTCSVATGSVELTGLPATGTWTLTQTPGGETAGTGVSTTVAGLVPGSYTFTVTSAGCISLSSAEAVILPQPSPPTLSIGTITNPATCLGNGSIVLNFTNVPDGTYTITYSTGSFSEVVIAGSTATLQAPEGTYNNLQVTYDGCTSATGVNASLSDPAAPTITGVTSGSRCGDGTVTLGATASEGLIKWYSEAFGGESLYTGVSFTTPVISTNTAYYVDATSNGCTTAERTAVIATVLQVPAAAGPVTGPATFTPGTTGVTYSVSPISGATGYSWSYSGTGVAINGSGNSVTLDFSAIATSGVLSVSGNNTCGAGTPSTLDLSPSTKTLNLSAVFLEGLYFEAGIMREAMGDSGPQWGTGVADRITVELHDATSYGSIVWSDNEVTLSTGGKAVVEVPGKHNGSYYITVKHRNSIETTTSSPVSFAGAVIDRPFGLPSGIYGANLIASGDGYFLIYGGDINQDGFVDSGDYPDVVNDNFNYISGYLPTDINGDGLIDSGDYPIMVNNNFNYVETIHP